MKPFCIIVVLQLRQMVVATYNHAIGGTATMSYEEPTSSAAYGIDGINTYCDFYSP